MINPEISVVISAFNASNYISESLNSIINQTFKNWECIVVDDGSTDTTIDIVSAYIAKDKRFSLIKTSGGNGPYICANIGIKVARGIFVARTDADDVSLPERLEIQYNYLENNNNINVIGSLNYYIFENGEKTFKPYNTDILFLKWQLIFRNKIVHSTMMFRKNWFSTVGYYPEKPLAQDWHIWLEAINNDTLYIINKPLIYWRIHHNSITKTQNLQQLVEASKVALFNLEKRMGLAAINPNAITIIIASIRGDSILPQTDLKTALHNLLLVFRFFKSENYVNRSIINDFHTTLDALFSKYPEKSLASVITYLQTILVAGISIRWLRGFIRHLFRI